MGPLDLLHGRLIYGRRVRALRDGLASALPAGGARVLDVGCGDGLVARSLMELRPELQVVGLDVLVRPVTHLPVTRFDGRHLPHGDGSFDAVTFVDVLHHAEDPGLLLAEAARVARRCVIVKDHLADAPLSIPRLRLMDWVGNARHGVALPYAYWTSARWREAFRAIGLTPTLWRSDLGLYPPGLEAVFGGALHCLIRLERGR